MHKAGLYDPEYEKDSCGVGMAVSIDGRKGHDIVESGLRILANMEHRGAENADGKTGDGSGITVQIPHAFFVAEGIRVPEAGKYGCGNVFLPRDEGSAEACLALIRKECDRYGLYEIACRDVPTDGSVPGPLAVASEPRIVQLFLTSYDSRETLERKLYSVRVRSINAVNASDIEGKEDFYICSLSTRTLTYKGMLTPAQLRSYYRDLTDERFESAIAMVHSRFSTNTFPMWKLAQPFRMLCHNGEINTIRANRQWMAARESVLETELLPDLKELFPIVEPGMSDSASLDNVMEFLTMTGRTMENALSLLIPESWNSRNPIPDSLKAYYEYHSILMEPWDGPAAVLFTDGRYAGGMLDRNGLRPARYTVTKDGLFMLASEAGVIEIPDSEITESGRLRPGKMVMIDTEEGRILRNDEIKSSLATAYPYRDWLDRNRLELDEVSSGRTVGRSVDDYPSLLAEFGYTPEDITKVMVPMMMDAKEPVGSAGYDTALPIMSDSPMRLFGYFRQAFAQVTNPPIDPIREELVMSITGYIGSIHRNMLAASPENCRIVKVRHPVITNRELDLLKNLRYRGFETRVIRMLFSEGEPLEKALDRICAEAVDAVREGGSYIILSDRGAGGDMIPIPSVLAVSAVHQHLLRERLRMQTDIIVESGEPRETMHFALLFGYGANVINPYMAYAVIDRIVSDDPDIKIDAETAERNYIRAAEKGLLKIMSKMGIATIRSYRGCMLFETIGISRDVCDRYLGGTPSAVGGMSLEDISRDALAAHRAASAQPGMLPDSGLYTHRRDGTDHSWTAARVRALRKAASENDKGAYAEFASSADSAHLFIRDVMEFRETDRVPLDEVESAESIMRRFVAEGISFGAISKEAHETIAEAMNSIGAVSNTGEGGEDPARSVPSNGRDLRSRVKQVASGRFGVTADYLTSADEIQIKIAQGAKPGEGGQLLSGKVDATIAAMRHCIPGITLISPPPHHDIYSIEDLKQLIFDLRCINPEARISVKLASTSGVGTVAVGVAKAGADTILISGADGGTGASPVSSLRYAGMPWETGLAETQQTLMLNGLRGRVRLQVDGQIRTGRDVVTAALLGAEEFGFATSLLVSMGCVMCRKCQTNTCPAGIATQDPDRRAKFKGCPNDIRNYLRMVAEDVRGHLSALGFRSIDEAVGRTDMIVRKSPEGRRSDSMDISRILESFGGDRRHTTGQPDMTCEVLDRRIIKDAMQAISSGGKLELSYGICNVDRSVGAMISGAITKQGLTLAKDSLRITFNGTAGQSFGAFLCKGVHFDLKGRANDFVGKGLTGGRISIHRDSGSGETNVMAGNTVLYGATSGEVYIAGSVGERFCVRNSGAVAVAEGAGDHCCEYMTGGCTVILGEVGRNFAAGMSAGVAYVLNDSGDFDRHCNMDMVELQLVESPEDMAELKRILENHLRYTGSPKAKEILDDWHNSVRRFLKVMPIGYKKILQGSS